MPLENDNEAERESRIDGILRTLREVQARVEQLAADGLKRAVEIHQEHRTSKERDPES